MNFWLITGVVVLALFVLCWGLRNDAAHSAVGWDDVEDEESEDEEAMTIVRFADPDGSEHDFVVVEVVEVDGKHYAILDMLDERGEVAEEEPSMICRVSEDGERLEMIEDEAEFDRVVRYMEENGQ